MMRYSKKGKKQWKKINMPKLGPDMGNRQSWRAWLRGGRTRHRGRSFCFEIETNKVVNQIEATKSGVLKQQLAEEGDLVAVNTAVAVLEVV